jgi:hypothetical protein
MVSYLISVHIFEKKIIKKDRRLALPSRKYSVFMRILRLNLSSNGHMLLPEVLRVEAHAFISFKLDNPTFTFVRLLHNGFFFPASSEAMFR